MRFSTATSPERTVVGYMHSKGGGGSGNPLHPYGRTAMNVMLTKVVIEDWHFVFDQFLRNEHLKTVGIANTCGGAAQFHNFWWARTSYAGSLPEPKFGPEIERHIYEFWLGEAGSRFSYNENITQTLSLCAPKYAKIPTPVPPKCDELIDDHAHEFGPGEKMNNMKYAILCSDEMLDRLGLRVYEKKPRN
jgi:hypothetical protein